MRSFCLLFVLSSLLSFISCQKTDNSQEIADLRLAVTALQKKSDSLSNALAATNTNFANQLKSIDSIKTQLVQITQQLTTLTNQLTTLTANFQSISTQIAALNAQYADLLAKLNAIQNQLNPPVNLTSGLVAYYPFNGNTNDESGNGNNGTIIGSVTLGTDRNGVLNRAYNFNGGTVSVPHNSSLAIVQGGQFTVSLWVNKTNQANPVHIIGKRPNGGRSFNWIIAQHVGAGSLLFTGHTGFNGVSTGVLSNVAINDNIWEHLLGVYNNGTWTIYLNGVLKAQVTSNTFTQDVVTPLEIGNTGGWGAFFGFIDEVRIYNRSLTQNEIDFLAKN